MSDLLAEIIAIGGAELEREDEFEQWFFGNKGESGGVLRIDMPCWRQYVFGRVLLAKYHPELRFFNEDRCFGELKIKFQRKKYFFILENWTQDEPLKALTESVDRLAKYSGKAFLLVFSANPFGHTEDHLARIDGLPGVESRGSVHRFRTKNEQGEDYEYWIGGWSVAPS